MSASLENDDLITEAIDKLFTCCLEAHNKKLQVFNAGKYGVEELKNYLKKEENIFEVDNQFKLNYFIKKALMPKRH